MSFSGKKFRRIGCENVDTLITVSRLSPHHARILNAPAPEFSFTRIGEDEFLFQCKFDSTRYIRYTFKLNEEVEVERTDGSKLKMVFSLERDNILNQVVRLPEGKTAYIRREFGESAAIMIFRIDGAEIEAKIYHELVE